MVDSQRQFGTTMRPNIQISHSLNGRVKDFAAAWGIKMDEAYRLVIEAGLAELYEGERTEDSDPTTEPMEFEDCPWCGEPIDGPNDAYWHLNNCPDEEE